MRVMCEHFFSNAVLLWTRCWARVMKSLGGEFAEFATVQDMAFLNDKRVETCLANLSTYGVDYERASERNT
jgi:hypothetical protein